MLVETTALFNIAGAAISMLVADYLDQRYSGKEPPPSVSVKDLRCDLQDHIEACFSGSFGPQFTYERDMVRGIVDGLVDNGFVSGQLDRLRRGELAEVINQ